MKLSEAISLGAMLSPQAIGKLEDAEGRRCALGAAIVAIGRWDDTEWKWAKSMVNCPDCWGVQPVVSAIAHLNNSHRWPRQQIAEWVSTIEPKQESSSEGKKARNCISHVSGD